MLPSGYVPGEAIWHCLTSDLEFFPIWPRQPGQKAQKRNQQNGERRFQTAAQSSKLLRLRRRTFIFQTMRYVFVVFASLLSWTLKISKLADLERMRCQKIRFLLLL